MRILHYFLGFPPYRTGGLTKYAYDLMCAQADNGDDVSALWPGKMEMVNHAPKIVRQKAIHGIRNYELVNPLPVPLDEGIRETEAFTEACDINVYTEFLKKINPEVIHIHTLMGLHREFIQATKALKIRTIFTTHDYFGLCPKVTLYKGNEACDDDHNCRDCVSCNRSALSLKKIWLMQSPLYRKLKNSSFVKNLRKRHRNEFFTDETQTQDILVDEKDAKKYRELRQYYIGMLSMIDCIHFNSTVTEKIYKRYFTPEDSRVLSITHKDIADNREKNTWKYTGKLRITSLAPAKPFKGYNILCQALDELWQSGNHNFELKIFSPVPVRKPYMVVQEEGFAYSQLGKIMADTDVLVAPSVWYETFGFTVLEALSYVVPVIVSEHVGAKDIVGDGGVVVKAGDKEALKKAIGALNAESLGKLRRNIREEVQIKTWKKFLEENDSLYKEKD